MAWAWRYRVDDLERAFCDWEEAAKALDTTADLTVTLTERAGLALWQVSVTDKHLLAHEYIAREGNANDRRGPRLDLPSLYPARQRDLALQALVQVPTCPCLSCLSPAVVMLAGAPAGHQDQGNPGCREASCPCLGLFSGAGPLTASPHPGTHHPRRHRMRCHCQPGRAL